MRARMDPNENKRDHPRVRPHVHAELIVADAGLVIPCRVDNVSLSGVLLDGGKGVNERQACEVRLHLSGLEAPVGIAVRGVVVRVRPDRCAVAFTEIDEGSFQRLRELVLANAVETGIIEAEFDSTQGIRLSEGSD